MVLIKNRGESHYAILFLLPWAVGACLFMLYPFFLALRTSFLSMNILSPEKSGFVGFENWLSAVKDATFWKSFFNVFYNQVVFITLSLGIALFFATLLYELKGKGTIYRVLLFVPVVTSIPVAYIIFKDFAGVSGPVQQLLVRLGILEQGVDWAFTRWLPMPVIAVFNSWKWFGVQMLILLGGFLGMNQSVLEAASVDGASWWQRYTTVVLPQLKPQIVFILTVNMINGLQMFSEVYVLFGSGGGIYESGLTPVLYLYDIGFAKQHMGYASALGLLLAGVIFFFTSIQLRLTRTGERE